MTITDQRRAEILVILNELERLHRESNEAADELDLYEARQAILRIEGMLRRQAAEAA